MMVNASHLEEENNENIRLLLSNLKQRFPRGSEQLILEVIYENHGNYEKIVHELTQRFGSPMHTQTLAPVVPSGPNPIYPPYTRYCVSDDQQNPADLRLQQRVISIDRLSNMRSDIPGSMRERSVSDTTGFFINGKAQPVRPFNMEMSGQNLLQHIRRQQESCIRLKEKVHNLHKETKRLQIEIHREEEELNTRSKVQKNPTERDIEKHREEIAILRKEVLNANNRLERARGEVNSGSTSLVSAPSPPSGHIDPQSPQQLLHQYGSSTSPLPVHPVSSARFPLAVRFPVRPVPEIPGPRTTNPITTPSDSEETQTNTDMWRCLQCTYDNHPDLQNCEMCDTKRYT